MFSTSSDLKNVFENNNSKTQQKNKFKKKKIKSGSSKSITSIFKRNHLIKSQKYQSKFSQPDFDQLSQFKQSSNNLNIGYKETGLDIIQRTSNIQAPENEMITSEEKDEIESVSNDQSDKVIEVKINKRNPKFNFIRIEHLPDDNISEKQSVEMAFEVFPKFKQPQFRLEINKLNSTRNLNLESLTLNSLRFDNISKPLYSSRLIEYQDSNHEVQSQILPNDAKISLQRNRFMSEFQNTIEEQIRRKTPLYLQPMISNQNDDMLGIKQNLRQRISSQNSESSYQ